jgi:4-hydroxybenzoate polyprenyltransferase
MEVAFHLLRAMRLRQWTKNVFVFVALIFAQRVADTDAVQAAVTTFLAFCLASSAAYLLNDIFDRNRDRQHPEKSKRPIAAGQLGVAPAAVSATILWMGGMVLAFFVNLHVLWIVGGYLVLQLLYSFLLKHVVILDLFVIAAGFVMRVAAGAEAIPVPISSWLFVCTVLISLFLGTAKRRHELCSLEKAEDHRATLGKYSPYLLDQMIAITAAATVVSYSLYTLSEDTIRKFGTDRLKWTIPFVLFGLFRYLYLVHVRRQGDQPEKVLLTDVPLLLNVLLYGAVVVMVLYLDV